jgi:hypothetical protein
MTFTTVFDAAQQGHPAWRLNGIGIALVGAGLLLVLAPDLMQRLMPYGLQGRARKIFSWFFLCVALVGAFFTFRATTTSFDAAAAITREGKFHVVEGQVGDFVPMPYTGHASERFAVGGKTFSYSDYILTGCFNNAASHGGPIKAGLTVRVSYVGNCIVRLEVAQ